MSIKENQHVFVYTVLVRFVCSHVFNYNITSPMFVFFLLLHQGGVTPQNAAITWLVNKKVHVLENRVGFVLNLLSMFSLISLAWIDTETLITKTIETQKLADCIK